MSMLLKIGDHISLEGLKREDQLFFPWVILGLISFFLPTFNQLVPPLIILLFVSVLFRSNRNTQKRGLKLFIPFLLFYAMYLIGFFISEDKDRAAFDLEGKLSFAVLPLLFFFLPASEKKTIRSILLFFVFGTFLSGILSWSQALMCLCEHGYKECYYTSYLAFKIHPTYLAVYYSFSFLILGTEWLEKRLNFVWLFLSFLFFGSLVYFLASKGGFIAFFVSILILLFYFFSKQGKLKLALIGTVFLLAAAGLIGSNSTIIKEKFKSAFNAFTMPEEELFETYRETTESSAVRMMIWNVVIDEMVNNPFGVGNGDTREVLLMNYKSKGMTGAYAEKLNCHNEFFQIGLGFGFPGLAFFFLFLSFLLLIAKRTGNLLFMGFMIELSLNFLFESMLEVQTGVVYFVFFACLFSFNSDTLNNLAQNKS